MLQPTIKNRTIFCKDNLDILQNINSDTIDLIYLDPPFNKKKMFHAPIGSAAEGASFKDIFYIEDIDETWNDIFRSEYPELYGMLKSMYLYANPSDISYMSYMAIRMIECHRILKDTGALYYHCDDTMQHYIKIMLDIVFGRENFRNEIIWHYPGGMKNATKMFAHQNDAIMYYVKNKKTLFNHQRGKINYDISQWKRWGNKSEDGRTIKFKHIPDTDKINKLRLIKQFKNKNNRNPLPEDTAWSLKGKLVDSVWSDISAVYRKKEKIGYPTQKPLALLERIIKASSNKGDIILDPFCGCATACVAAEKLNRKWIGIDVSHKAFDLVKKRLEKEVQGEKENGERDLLNYKKEVHYTTIPPKRTDQGKDNLLKKYVYVISNPKYKGEYKVGIAKDYKARLNSYQTSDPDRNYQLEYTVYTPLFREIEKYIHNKFENKHEWISGKLENIIKAIENYKV